ncbi:SusD/RagB family nutrient-binding outer membrane lipoprotein [Capnocytophaga sp. G2]|uniref:SusD/RagB family nutrient-binding outer membrane lipoprotein n=1 Tax=Capnocytophaga sp. G2 TaxID=3110695 RepID=UPI002B46E61D|nr:SusD/RagB family nutrient-binding outer membrane lipoprotein [Capnocytophaga sp. G2]MEB3005051.1 SusD/RagB family nutrient-binding outer membrane lipoprotein [Capnocytophaga sp. G2]
MKRILITTLGVGFLLASCTKDFEDINKNPNVPEEYLTYALFNGNNEAFLNNTRGYDNMKQMRVWMQYTSQPIYTKESRYLRDPNGSSTLYFNAYKRAMGYKEIIRLNTDPKTKDIVLDYGKNNNQIAAARIMLAYIFSIMVQSFGDVPYYSYGDSENPHFQALQTDKYVTPVYASEKEIYLDILKELEAAIVQIEPDSYVFSSGDFLFGKPENLKKFANSLRLRIANHLKGANEAVLGSELAGKVKTIIDYYRAGHEDELLDTTFKSVELSFEDNYTYPAPIYYDYYVGNRVDYLPSSNFIKLLAGNNKKANNRGLNFGVDPRIEKYFAPVGLGKWDIYYGYTLDQSTPIDTTKYVGMPYGMQEGATADQYKGGEAVSLFSQEVLASTAAEVIMDYSEVCFILSEIRGWDNALYRKAVEASLDKWGITGTRKSDYMSTLPAATEENVLTQKYISLYMNPDEAWAEYRRTGYPKTFIEVGERVRANLPAANPPFYVFQKDPSAVDVSGIPDRLSYPDTYTGLNLNYKQALKDMGILEDLRGHKLIFATRN